MCGWRPGSCRVSFLPSPNPSDIPPSVCPIRKANKSMRLLICIVIATSVPGKCDSLPISAMFRFMVTRVSPGIFKRKNCRSKSTKLSEISLVFVVSSNRCSVRQPGTLSLIYWPWIMQMCTPHTPSSPSANGTRANIYSESAPSSIFPSFFISLLLFSPSEVHSHIKSAITGGQITGNFLWVRLAKRSQDPIPSCSPMCLCIYLCNQ